MLTNEVRIEVATIAGADAKRISGTSVSIKIEERLPQATTIRNASVIGLEY